jgi:hypothetical protein
MLDDRLLFEPLSIEDLLKTLDKLNLNENEINSFIEEQKKAIEEYNNNLAKIKVNRQQKLKQKLLELKEQILKENPDKIKDFNSFFNKYLN